MTVTIIGLLAFIPILSFLGNELRSQQLNTVDRSSDRHDRCWAWDVSSDYEFTIPDTVVGSVIIREVHGEKCSGLVKTIRVQISDCEILFTLKWSLFL